MSSNNARLQHSDLHMILMILIPFSFSSFEEEAKKQTVPAVGEVQFFLFSYLTRLRIAKHKTKFIKLILFGSALKKEPTALSAPLSGNLCIVCQEGEALAKLYFHNHKLPSEALGISASCGFTS